MTSIASPAGGEGSRSRALMRELLMNLPAAVAFVSGPDLVYEFANEDYRQMFGGRKLAGLPLREALPEFPAERLAALHLAARTGAPFQGRESELWLRRYGGELEQLFMDFVYQPVRNDDGGIEGVLLYGTDVTGHVRDRRRLELLARQLATSEERYRTLFETLPVGVIHFNANGTVLGANDAATEILGLTDDLSVEFPKPDVYAIREDGTTYAQDDLPVMVALRTGEIVPGEIMGMVHGRTGELRWLQVAAVPDARDSRGTPQRAYVMISDITEQRRAETALRESTRLLGRLRDANVLGVLVGSQDGIQEANDAYLDIIGRTREDLATGRITWDAITPPEWVASDIDAIKQLRSRGVCEPYEKEQWHRDGRRVPTLVGAAVLDWDPLRWVMFVVDLTTRQRAEQERAALLAREQSARAEAATAWERLASLMRAGNLVAATRDPDELLERVTQLVVPSLADYCVALIPAPDGTLRVAKVTHRDLASGEVLEQLRDYPLAAAGPLISQVAYTTGTTQLAGEFDTTAPNLTDAAPEVMRILSRLDAVSSVAVPLLAEHQHSPLGVLVLGRGADRPRFAETDAAVVEELARRLASGLATVETFAREHTVAETLQHALLPDTPSPVPGLDLAVRYLPATDGVHVGGDWYDAFPLGNGRVGLVIGDVAGHSIASASVMGQVRSLLHGYAIDNPYPPDVLRRTNIAVCQMLPEAFATAWYGVLDPATGDLVYANAGHPPPLLSVSRGQAEYLDAEPSAMIGSGPDITFTAAKRRLPAGSRLLLYTDGLIEDRTRDITDGLSALRQALERAPGKTAEQTCQTALAALLGTAARADDVCLLAVGLATRPAAAARSVPLPRHQGGRARSRPTRRGKR